MPKKPRSARLTTHQHDFLDRSDFSFGEEVRSWLDDQQVKHAAGVCAGCGKIVYIGGHMVINGGTPIGNHLGLESGEDIDLCESCEGEAFEGLREEDAQSLALDYIQWWGDYALYRADRDAIADAQPDAPWAALITPLMNRLRGERTTLIQEWANNTDLHGRYGQSNGDLATRIEAALADAD